MNDSIAAKVMLFSNGRMAIQLQDVVDCAPYGRLNVNVPDEDLADDEIAINWDLDAGTLKSVLSLGKFEQTDRVVMAGRAVCPVWKVICPEMLKEAAQLRTQIKRPTRRRISQNQAVVR